MIDINLAYSDFKNDIIIKGFPINYAVQRDSLDESTYWYELFAIDRQIRWVTKVTSSSDITNFETYYKSKCNKCLYDSEGKEYQRAESRPLNCTTVFAGAGDSVNNIGDGKELVWDFSNDDDLIVSDSNIKRKRIEFKFLDQVYVKEGAIYFHNAKKGSYVDIYIVCPAGNYYYKNDGSPAYASVDTKIAHYIINQKFQGDCPMGDEFNTETCSAAIPNNYKFWIDVTVPVNDSESNGYITLEMYRTRTVVL